MLEVWLGMFERFTERARQVIVLAQQEAQSLMHNYIGTEHLLLGLQREEEGLAARVLVSLGMAPIERVRMQIVSHVGSGDAVTSGQVPFTPRGKRVLEHALREALSLGHDYIGTEHILLGIVREGEGVAARVLAENHVVDSQVREAVVEGLREPSALPLPRKVAQRRLALAEAWLAASRSPEAVVQAVAAAADEVNARTAVAQLLDLEEWVAEYVVREPVLRFNRSRISELEAKVKWLRQQPQAAAEDDTAA